MSSRNSGTTVGAKIDLECVGRRGAACGGLAVDGGLAAPVLLLLHSRRATRMALVSLVAQACLDVLTFAFRNRWDVFGPRSAGFDLGVLLLTLGLAL